MANPEPGTANPITTKDSARGSELSTGMDRLRSCDGHRLKRAVCTMPDSCVAESPGLVAGQRTLTDTPPLLTLLSNG